MIGVTGVSGHLGRLAVESLLDRGVATREIVALARSTEKAKDLADRGVEVRNADYTRQETLSAALDGVDRLLLVSSSEVGQRAAQHRNVVEAARAGGVRLLGYTSILRADASGLQLAAEHRETEETIRAAGIPFVFLRNGWYIENYTDQLPVYLQHGAILGSAGDGRVSAATRADYAEAAAAALTGSGHEGRVYELGGDDAFTMTELAAEISRQSGKTVEYRNLPEAAYAEALVGVGLPAPFARVLADSDRGLAQGELYTESRDLSRLIGRPTTTLREAVAGALER